ncbi:T9SS type A sorting domain-containing protein [Polaribacter septentrionalilitoris]|uniref:T9SS type A sorting domain-containing protein n=1 Tax=Polaribacter septentrionalilitoris TaxID=2494657 RepID=UPI001356748E|nr:T9SS type A sorting domain-containing protein [Polaribacter septentrionalilitoris]
MKKNYFLLLTFLFFSALFSRTVAQSKGDIAIVGYNTDGTGDGFAIVALADIAANSTIYFTDSDWDETGTAFVDSGTDAIIDWDSGASTISAGTIITFTNVDRTVENGGASVSVGSLTRSGGTMNLINGGETLFAYLGTDENTPTLFLTGYRNGAVGTDLTGTSLTPGVDFIELGPTKSISVPDAGLYNGERANLGSFSDYFVTINQPSNWEVTNAGGVNYLPSSPTNFTIDTDTPSKGDIAFVGFDTDAADGFAIAALADIPANTTIYFTDYEWDETNSGSFTASGTDAFLTWNSGNNVIIAGRIIHFTGIDTGTSDVSIGSITIDGTMNLLNPGETAFAYLGSDKNTPSLFLTGYKNETVTTDLAGTGLTVGTDFLQMNNNTYGLAGNGDTVSTTNPDQGRYKGSRGDQASYSNYFSIINTTSNWDGVDPQSLANADNITPFSSASFTINTSLTNFTNGAGDNDWNNAGNWSFGIPTSSSSVTIINQTVTIPSGETFAGNIRLVGSSTLSIASGAGLTVTGEILSPADDVLIIESGGSLILLGNETALENNVKASLDLATTNWYNITSPVTGQNIDAFVAASGLQQSTTPGKTDNIALGTYNTADDTWTYYQDGANASGNFVLGKGYSINLDGGSGTLDFSGDISATDFSTTLVNTGNGFNFLGNPFTSYIPANNPANTTNILASNSGILDEATIWVWNQANNGGAGGYDTFVVGVGDALNIAPGQGFFVKAASASSFVINRELQSHQATPTFQKSNNLTTKINLKVKEGNSIRDTDIYYLEHKKVTKAFDNGYDGSLFGSNGFSIYTKVVSNDSDKNLAIQALPNKDFESMVVPVGISADAGKEISFSTEIENLPTDIKVFIEDTTTNTITRIDELNSEYKVTLNEALNGTGRFYLHTKSNSALSTKNTLLEGVRIYKFNDQTLRLTGNIDGNISFKLYNILGKQILNSTLTLDSEKNIKLPKLSKGIYVVNIESSKGSITKKIIL